MRPLRYIVYVIVVSLPLWAYIPTQELIKAYRGFEPNYGQVQDFEGKPVKDIIFSTKAPGLNLFFKKDGVSYVIYSKTNEELNSFEGFDLKERLNKEDSSPLNYARVDLELVGGNIDNSKIVFEDELPGYVNYYLPGCPEGITNLKTYRVVRVKDVYPGIDWVFRYDADGNLHHEFVVKPEGNPDEIKLKVKWADVKLSDDGSEIILSTPVGDILDGSIYAYEGDKRVKVNYVFDDGLLAYDVRGWRRNENLVIDPPLGRLWATYYGGNIIDWAHSITTDPQGNVYVVGWTESDDFPVSNPDGGAYYQGSNAGYSDAFILKFNSSGVRLWATYYGGSDYDWANSVATDPQGNVYVVGWTRSTDFPIYNPGGGAYYQGNNAGGYDAFILKFNSSGVRRWATYYGGSGLWEEAFSVATDPQGNVYVVGQTGSTNFPVYNPGGGAYYQGSMADTSDAFILKFNSSGVRLWATYYGGSGDDFAHSVATDPQGYVYVVGWTRSTNFPVYYPGGGAYYQGTIGGGSINYTDAFILKFYSSGMRLWATYYGGNYNDSANSVATDLYGNVYVAGNTHSTDFPVYNPYGAYYQQNNNGYSDAFLLKFMTGDGPTLVFPGPLQIINTSPVNFVWKTFKIFGGYNRYQLQISTNSNFNPSNTYLTADTSYSVNLSDGIYYWRVRAVASNTSDSTSWTASLFELDKTPPTVPNLVSPSNGAAFNTSSVTLIWNRSQDNLSGMDQYEIQLANNPSFTNPTTYLTSDTTYSVSNLNEGTYYWRVRAKDNAGNYSGWSSSRSFTLDRTAPTVPNLVSPSNGAAFNTSSVTLIWNRSQDNLSGMDQYEIQLANNPSFTNPASYLTSDTTYSISNEGTYYWRVRAKDNAGNYSGWSSSRSFTLDRTAPTIPNLVSPDTNAMLNTSSVTLIWNRSRDYISGVGQYEIQLANNPSFTNPTTYLTSDTTYSVSNLNEGTYYWRVRAKDNAGNYSAWSSSRKFTIDRTAPTAPNLVSPSNGAAFNTSSVTLIWNRSQDNLSGMDQYEIQLANNPSFTNPTTYLTSDTTYSISNLNEGTYYWRVKAKDNAGNYSEWSNVWSYEVDMTAPNTPNLVTPVGEYLRNTIITFIWTRVSKMSKDGEKPAPVVYDFYIDTTSNFATALNTTIQDTTLILTLQGGRYYWKVRARDLAENIGNFSTTASFVLDITPPVMESTTVWHDTTYMGPFYISTRTADNLAGVNVVKLFYKRSTDSSWVEVVMNYNSGNGRYEGQIPAVSQAGDSVYYYVWASDSAGNEATDPANAPGNCYRFKVITTSVNDVVTKPDIKVFTKGSLIIVNISSPQPTEVKLSIYDITGRPTYGPITKNISSGFTKFEIQVPRSGIYFYEVETPLMKDRGKVVIVK